MPDSLAILDRLISFPTVSRNSNLDLIEYARATLSAAGVQVRLIANQTANAQPFTPPSTDWRVLIDSEDTRYAGSGTFKPLAAYQAVLYEVGE